MVRDGLGLRVRIPFLKIALAALQHPIHIRECESGAESESESRAKLTNINNK